MTGFVVHIYEAWWRSIALLNNHHGNFTVIYDKALTSTDV